MLECESISPIVGARVHGLSFNEHAIKAMREELGDLMKQYQLLVFPDAGSLTASQQRSLLECFGDVWDEKSDGTYYSTVNNRVSADLDEGDECLFHCDYSFRAQPVSYISLYGELIPTGSAMTSFINAQQLCEMLPQQLYNRLIDRSVVHASDVTAANRTSARPVLPEDLEQADISKTTHPAILSHPKTGREIIFINRYLCARVSGMDHEESTALLNEVFEYLYAPEHLFQFEWNQDDVMVFDNLALQHMRVKGRPRLLRRMICF